MYRRRVRGNAPTSDGGRDRRRNIMGDRFYTTLNVTSHDGIAAQQAVIDAMGKDSLVNPCFYSKWDSGESVIQKTLEVSKDFPNEVFTLNVVGGCGEGIQGLVTIIDGEMFDERSEEVSYGRALEEVTTCTIRRYTPSHPDPYPDYEKAECESETLPASDDGTDNPPLTLA